MKTIYAIPNYECNLNCPHCKLSNKHVDFNRENFLNLLNSFNKDDNIILFGGEPTLYKDRFLDCMNTKKVTSVSTNLMTNDIKILDNLSIVSVATSWNKSRFSTYQYKLWLKNLEYLGKNDTQCKVLITLTHDLVNDMSILSFLQVLDDIQDTNSVLEIAFEHYVGDDETILLHQTADEWLCKLHDKWNYSFINSIELKIFIWQYDCSNVYTLLPSGKLVLNCPQYERQHVLEDCLSCTTSNVCKPCKLHKVCTFPLKLYYVCSK